MSELRFARVVRSPPSTTGFCGLFCALIISCTSHTTTQRVVQGRIVEGRYIAPEAYAAVMHAELLAAQGQLKDAYAAYQEASDIAGYSAEIWTQLGALSCQLQRNDYRDAFAHAEKLDPNYEPLWRERARCALNKGHLPRAVQTAQRATALDPDQPQNTELVARALARMQDSVAAAQWRNAFELRRHLALPQEEAGAPTSVALTASHRTRTPSAIEQQAALERSLRAGNLAAARVVAQKLRLDPTELALRALQLGLPQMALEQAQLVLLANPLDSDARVAALTSADLLRDDARFLDLLAAPLRSSELRPGARAELIKLLARRALIEGSESAATPTPPATE